MSGVLRYLKRLFGAPKTVHYSPTSAPRDLTRFAEGDRLLIDNERLSPPLQRNAKTEFKRGILDHNSILGQPIATIYAQSAKGSFKIEQPTLDQYVSLTPRLVTPVYASYASTIVSILDINPVPANDERAANVKQSLEILEAGTGHGSLTLHIARAIASANPPFPPADLPTPSAARRQEPVEATRLRDEHQAAWDTWKQRRRAILHTVEAVPDNRVHAEKIVRGFRQGIYWPHVDFYEGEVGNWIKAQLKSRCGHGSGGSADNASGFLDAVVLDMPSVHKQLSNVRPALREGGRLLVFVPSITQIGECARVIAESDLPFVLDRVVELGEGISNGRKWDVRLAMPRKGNLDKIKAASKLSEPMALDEEVDPNAAAEEAAALAEDKDEPVMVCRPMVGERTFGGGFIALWKNVNPTAMEAEQKRRKRQSGSAARKRFR